MSLPRRVLPGTVYLVTRKCSGSRFLLRPSALTNQIFQYVLAVAARRYGIAIHAVAVMSNHTHLVLTDSDNRLPRFMQYLNSLVARAVNASLGRWESLWGPPSYSAVALTAPSDIVAKCAYAIANPVAAGLVRSSAEWPGVCSTPERIAGGTTISAERPRKFFNPRGRMPEKVTLELSVPPGFDSAEDFRARVAAAVAELEEQARQKRASEGRGFLGPARVLAQPTWSRPAAAAPRRNLNPRVACRDKWKRIEALGRLKQFVKDYREAWAKFRAGDRTAVFPAGTYLMRVMYGVPCAAASG